MANGKRNKITSAGKATRENRMVLFMLFQIFNFSDSEDEAVRQQLAAIFIALYDDFKEYNYYNLADRNVQRLKAGHQNADWKAIDRPNEWNNTTWDAGELAHFATLRNDILREAARLGIPISYKTNPEKKHRPLIPGLVAAPTSVAPVSSTQAPTVPPQHFSMPSGQTSGSSVVPASHPQPLPTANRSTVKASSSATVQHDIEGSDGEEGSEDSDLEDFDRDHDQGTDHIQDENDIDEATENDSESDDEENITWSDDVHPREADSGIDQSAKARRSHFMDALDDFEDEEEEGFMSEEDSEDEDITWTNKNISHGRFSSEELQQHAIALMNAAREAENPEETVYGREAGGYLTPSWVVTEEVVQEELAKQQKIEKLQDLEKRENEKLSDGKRSQGSLFSDELATLIAEVGETDVGKMLAHFAETGKA